MARCDDCQDRAEQCAQCRLDELAANLSAWLTSDDPLTACVLAMMLARWNGDPYLQWQGAVDRFRRPAGGFPPPAG